MILMRISSRLILWSEAGYQALTQTFLHRSLISATRTGVKNTSLSIRNYSSAVVPSLRPRILLRWRTQSFFACAFLSGDAVSGLGPQLPRHWCVGPRRPPSVSPRPGRGRPLEQPSPGHLLTDQKVGEGGKV